MGGEWRDGDPLPRGMPPPSMNKANKPVRPPTWVRGKGTIKDPKVYWQNIPEWVSDTQLEACTDIIAADASSNGFCCALIRKENHGTTMTNAREQAQTGQVSGHVYTLDDKNGIPIRPLRPDERRYGPKNQRTSTEYWKLDGQPKPRNPAKSLVPRR